MCVGLLKHSNIVIFECRTIETFVFEYRNDAMNGYLNLKLLIEDYFIVGLLKHMALIL